MDHCCRTISLVPEARKSDGWASLMRGVLILFICGGTFISPPTAAGQVGITAGTEYGLGVVARVGTSAIMLEAGGGITPILVLGTERVEFGGSVVSDEVFFEVFVPATVGAKLSVRIGAGDDDVTRTGLELGASFNSLLRLGLGGGFNARVSERLVLSAGLMYYSEAGERLGEELNRERGYPLTGLDLGPLVRFQPYAGLSLLFF